MPRKAAREKGVVVDFAAERLRRGVELPAYVETPTGEFVHVAKGEVVASEGRLELHVAGRRFGLSKGEGLDFDTLEGKEVEAWVELPSPAPPCGTKKGGK